MSVSLEFFVAMVPRRKNRLIPVRFGKFVKLRPDADGKQAQETLAARCYEHRPPAPFTGPVRLDVTFCMPVGASWPAWRRAAALEGRLYPTSRPDRGNLLKLLEDALRGPFYADDALVVAGEVAKAYGDPPGYLIRLAPLAQATAPEHVRATKGPRQGDMVVLSETLGSPVTTRFLRPGCAACGGSGRIACEGPDDGGLASVRCSACDPGAMCD